MPRSSTTAKRPKQKCLGHFPIIAVPPSKTVRSYTATPALERELKQAKGAKELDCLPDFFTESLDDAIP